MVEINTKADSIKINVASLGTEAAVGIISNKTYYEGLAKQWAVSDLIVDGVDYSAKYYANQAKILVKNLQNTADNVINVKNDAIAEIKKEGNGQIEKLQAVTSNLATKAEATYTAGEGISIKNNVISNIKTSLEWGNIEGDIENQADLNDILTAQQTKITELNATSRSYLLGAYENGTSWWRVYSDGWIEQGGVGTGSGAVHITFLKQFKSASFVLHCQNHQNTTVAGSNRFGFNKSVTGFDVVNDAGVPYDWMAVGY